MVKKKISVKSTKTGTDLVEVFTTDDVQTMRFQSMINQLYGRSATCCVEDVKAKKPPTPRKKKDE